MPMRNISDIGLISIFNENQTQKANKKMARHFAKQFLAPVSQDGYMPL